MPTPKQLHAMRDFYRRPDFVVHEIIDISSSDEDDNHDEDIEITTQNNKSFSSSSKDKLKINYQIKSSSKLDNKDDKISVKNNTLFKCVDYNKNVNHSSVPYEKKSSNISTEVINKNYLTRLSGDIIHSIILYIDIESIYNLYLSCASKFIRQNLRKTLVLIHTGSDNEIFTYSNQSCNNRIASLQWALNSISGNYDIPLNDFSSKYTNIKNTNLKNIEICIINNNENNSNIDILTKHKNNLLHLSHILASGIIRNLEVLKIKFDIGDAFDDIDLFFKNLIQAVKFGYLDQLTYFGLEIEGMNNVSYGYKDTNGDDDDDQSNYSLLYYINKKCPLLKRLDGLKYFNIADYKSLIPYYYLKEQNLVISFATDSSAVNQTVEENKEKWLCLESINLGAVITSFANHSNLEYNIAVLVVLKTLTVCRFPSLKKLELCFNDSNEILLFFTELSKLINDQYENNTNENDCFIGKQIESIYINQDNINARESLELQQEWNDLFKNNKFNHKPNDLSNTNKQAFPNVSILHINHWLPSVQLLMNVIGCNKDYNGLHLIIAAGNECPSFSSFLLNYWDESILPIHTIQLVHRNMNSYDLLDSFINFDKVSIKIKTKLFNVNSTKPYQDSLNNAVCHIYNIVSAFRDEFSVDIFDETSFGDKSMILLENNDKVIINNDTINYLSNSYNIVNTSIYKSILFDKMINVKELGFTDIFLDLLLQDDDNNINDGIVTDEISNSSGFILLPSAIRIIKNIMDKCLNLKGILFTFHPSISTNSLDIYVNEISYKLFILILSLKNIGINPCNIKPIKKNELNNESSSIKFSYVIINIPSFSLLQKIELKLNLFFKSWNLIETNDGCYVQYIGNDKLLMNFDSHCYK